MAKQKNKRFNIFIDRKNICIRLRLEFDYKKFFINNGYNIIKNPKKADLIIYDTCASTHYSENRCIQRIANLNKIKKKDSQLIVCGCMAKISKKRIQHVFKKEIIIIESLSDLKKVLPKNIVSGIKTENVFIKNTFLNSNSKSKLLNLISNIKISRFYFSDYIGFIYKLILNKIYNIHDVESGFHILISVGCLNDCSYCAIKFAKGVFRSKSFDNVVEEFEKGLGKGYKKFYLHAEDIGCYGKDIDTSLIALLDRLVDYKRDFEINLVGLHMKWLVKDFKRYCKIFDSGKVHRLVVPLQSGSGRVLGLMNRGYDIDVSKKLLKEIKCKYPDISLQTHIIVGFPSETWSDFEDSVNLIKEIDFDYVKIHMFSCRLGTKAYGMKGQLSSQEIGKRAKYLKSKFRNQRLKKYLNFY